MDDVVARVKAATGKKATKSSDKAGLKKRKEAAISRKTAVTQSFETSRIRQIEKSERRAWNVAIGACLITALSWAALVFLLPLKTVESFVVRVDETTGSADIIQTTNEVFVSNNEAVDNYWVNRFVLAYENYDYWTIQRDYDHVGSLSTDSVGKEYAKKFIGDEALDKVYAANTKVTIEIESIVPTGEFIKTVRFRKYTTDTKRGVPPKEEYLVATVGFMYSSTVKMTAAQRLVNPLGFYVRSYRVDEEL